MKTAGKWDEETEAITSGRAASCVLKETDIATLEKAGEALIRSGCTQTAIEVLALALRLRAESGLHPQRRSDDARS